MKSIIVTALFSLLLIASGCTQAIFAPDFTPPAAPRGLSTETGDGMVELFWLRNTERDVAGYNIYSSVSFSGHYEYIGKSRSPYFLDNGTTNGRTYYYAVTAYDHAGNESELSTNVVYDTPRPEGLDVALQNSRLSPSIGGYDFSTYSVGRFDDEFTDVYFESDSSGYYLVVWEDSDIQDMGYTGSLYEIGEAPATGWSPSKDVRVIPGHTYVIWTWDDHYAKLRVTQLSSSRVVFDWAYQLQTGNPRLKTATSRGTLVKGPGAAGR